jgi:small subunit ribosomal protein S4
MSRYRGPRLRIVRRLGKLRGLTRKKPFRRIFKGKGPLAQKVIPPGQHGYAKLFGAKSSDYLIRLKVKQRLRYNYGLTEKQLVRYVQKAKNSKGSTGGVLLQLLEMRLDNIVFRLNMAPTIVAARQFIVHGHIRVNGKKVNIPSYMCKPKEVISVAMKEKSLRLVHQYLQAYTQKMRVYKNRLEKTLAFILVKTQKAESLAESLQLIAAGQVQVNNRKITLPNYIPKPKDQILIKNKEASIQI